MVVGPVAAGDQPRPVELVEARLLEADREGLHRAGLLAGGEGDDPGRVDPAGEQHADRDVGDEVCPDRVAQGLAQLVRQLPLWTAPGLSSRDGLGARVPRLLDLPVMPGEQGSGRELACLGEDRQRRRDRVESEVGGDGLGIYLAREAWLLQHRLQLGGKRQDAPGKPVVERLDPETVAGQEEAVPARVPERDREHPP